MEKAGELSKQKLENDNQSCWTMIFLIEVSLLNFSGSVS